VSEAVSVVGARVQDQLDGWIMPMGNLQHLESVLLHSSPYSTIKSLLLNTAHDPRLVQGSYQWRILLALGSFVVS
jgi:hypothetical protein